MYKISLIVPVYNSEKYLHRCLDSIIHQTYNDFELILVDDGSTDHSGAICDKYADEDPRIHVFHQVNSGQAVARNNALDWVFENSASEYIAFADSDDWLHPRYLELLLKAIQVTGTNISQCFYTKTSTELNYEFSEPEIIKVTPEEQFIHYYSSLCWGKMFKKDCFKEIRFPEGVIYEDVLISYKMLFAEEYISIVKEILYYYYLNPESTTNKDWTPRHYMRIQAWENQRVYFSTFASEALLANVMKRYMSVLCVELEHVRSSGAISQKDRIEYTSKMRFLLRKFLIEYRRILTVDKNRFLEAAYPTGMRCYWTAKGITHGIKKRISKINKFK